MPSFSYTWNSTTYNPPSTTYNPFATNGATSSGDWYYYLIQYNGSTGNQMTITNITLDPNYTWYATLVGSGGVAGASMLSASGGGGGGGQVVDSPLTANNLQVTLYGLVENYNIYYSSCTGAGVDIRAYGGYNGGDAPTPAYPRDPPTDGIGGAGGYNTTNPNSPATSVGGAGNPPGASGNNNKQNATITFPGFSSGGYVTLTTNDRMTCILGRSGDSGRSGNTSCAMFYCTPKTN